MDHDEDVTAPPDSRAIADAFDLSGGVGPMVPVPGAWSNRVFRLSVGRGDYAVKELLDPWHDGLRQRWREWLSEAWALEPRAIAAGVSAPKPVPNPTNGDCLALVPRDGTSGDLASVRVHRWVAGTCPGQGPVDDDLARWAGGVLATLHGLGMKPGDRGLFPTPNTDNANRWDELVDAARAAGVMWVEQMERARAAVATAAELVEAAGHHPELEVMTHGDVDPKNVVVSATGPVLCDWDVAAPLVPRRELADVALSFAGWERLEIASQVIAAYRRAGGDDTRITSPDLGQPLMIGIDWLVLNLERALRLRPVSRREAHLGLVLVPRLLAQLPDHVDLALRVEELLDQ